MWLQVCGPVLCSRGRVFEGFDDNSAVVGPLHASFPEQFTNASVSKAVLTNGAIPFWMQPVHKFAGYSQPFDLLRGFCPLQLLDPQFPLFGDVLIVLLVLFLEFHDAFVVFLIIFEL